MDRHEAVTALVAVAATLEFVNGFRGTWLHFVASALFSVVVLPRLWRR